MRFAAMICSVCQSKSGIVQSGTFEERQTAYLAREGVLQEIQELLCAFVVSSKQRPYPPW